VDGFVVLLFVFGASIEEEGEWCGEEQEDDDYDCGYYAAVQARAVVCCCVFEAK